MMVNNKPYSVQKRVCVPSLNVDLKDRIKVNQFLRLESNQRQQIKSPASDLY